jgi:hypothetical protein
MCEIDPANLPVKQCQKCGIYKPLLEMAADRRKKDGRENCCRMCRVYGNRSRSCRSSQSGIIRKINKDEMTVQRLIRVINRDFKKPALDGPIVEIIPSSEEEMNARLVDVVGEADSPKSSSLEGSSEETIACAIVIPVPNMGDYTSETLQNHVEMFASIIGVKLEKDKVLIDFVDGRIHLWDTAATDEQKHALETIFDM